MESKVRILNIIGKRPTGGIGAVVYNYQKHFDKDLVEVDYMIFDDNPDGDFDKKVKAIGSKVYVMPKLMHKRIFKLYKELNIFFRANSKKYDVVHLHSTNIGFLCYPLAKKYGIKHLISHSHATMYSDKKLNSIRNAILCLPIKKMSNIYFACSKAAGEFLYGKKLVDSGKVKIINNAIECNKFKFNRSVREDYRERMGISDKLVIGNVGRFNEQKNHKFLIEIFNEIRNINNNSVLVLVGDGELKDSIESKVKKMGLEKNVIFLGQRDDIEKLLQAFDIFLLPSLYEGLPVIGVEAQAAGLPCVFSQTITQEVNINNVKYIDLKTPASEWGKEIIQYYKESPREVDNSSIVNLGFDIKTEAIKLQNFYYDLLIGRTE